MEGVLPIPPSWGLKLASMWVGGDEDSARTYAPTWAERPPITRAVAGEGPISGAVIPDCCDPPETDICDPLDAEDDAEADDDVEVTMGTADPPLDCEIEAGERGAWASGPALKEAG